MIFLTEPKFASCLSILWPVSNSQSCGLIFPMTLTTPTSGTRHWVQAKTRIFPTSKTMFSPFTQVKTRPKPQPTVLTWALSVEGSPRPSHQPFSKIKAKVSRPMQTPISVKTSCSQCCHSPNLSKASAIAWFFTMSMSPRPRQKCGKIKNTDFRISLMLFSF